MALSLKICGKTATHTQELGGEPTLPREFCGSDRNGKYYFGLLGSSGLTKAAEI